MKRLEILLLIFFFLFSCWLMNKSFGYSPATGQFRLARHQIGDFGLHLSLIRSFSWGNIFPVESPFFPGQSLPYHYAFDLAVGLLERLGLRLDYAFNGLSALALTAILFLIYQFSQTIFGENKILGLLSVGLFLSSSSLSFVDFFRQGPSLREFWFLPDYLHKGPFDGSLISIFFTPNVWLNQRHLLAGLAISLAILNFIISRLINDQPLRLHQLLGLGLILGVSFRIHSLIFFSSSLTLFLLVIFFRRWRQFWPFFLAALVAFLPHGRQILQQDLSYSFWRPGFLASGLEEWLRFWWLNFGVALFTIPAGVILAAKKQRLIFFSFLPLLIIGNLFQLGFRIDHNHSLFNLFFLIANFYGAFFLVWLIKQGNVGKILFFTTFFLLTFSGGLNLMAVKNDFQFSFPEKATGELMTWIRKESDPGSVFLAPPEILDPVTLAGRDNYCGHDYYLEVMGYNFTDRKQLAKRFFSASNQEEINLMRKEGINYLLLPVADQVDFFQKNLAVVFQNTDWLVFKL